MCFGMHYPSLFLNLKRMFLEGTRQVFFFSSLVQQILQGVVEQMVVLRFYSDRDKSSRLALPASLFLTCKSILTVSTSVLFLSLPIWEILTLGMAKQTIALQFYFACAESSR